MKKRQTSAESDFHGPQNLRAPPGLLRGPSGAPPGPPLSERNKVHPNIHLKCILICTPETRGLPSGALPSPAGEAGASAPLAGGAGLWGAYVGPYWGGPQCEGCILERF